MLYFLYLSVFIYIKFVVATNNCQKRSADPLQCGLNEVAVRCRTTCPPQNCEIAYTEYACDKYKNICERGCDCLPNYLRNGSGICIPNEQCTYPTSPICGVNEIARDCRRICPPQTCQSRKALYKCAANIPCEPGCDCVPNYLRNSDGICIPAEQCDVKSNNCCIPNKCIRTCASPNPPYCPYSPAKTNIDGCECMEGYILSEAGGKCIRIEDCPVGCNGDIHARPKRRPLACPSTCMSPDATLCKKLSESLGCECEPGYLLSSKNGKCILPDKCPAPINCTRPNEVYDGCPSPCFSGNCEDRAYQNATCNTLVLNCQPKCVCQNNTFRNSCGICVPELECDR